MRATTEPCKTSQRTVTSSNPVLRCSLRLPSGERATGDRVEAGRPGLKRLLHVGGSPRPSLCHHGAVSLDLTVSWAMASLQPSHSHSAADKQKVRSRQEASAAKVTGAFKCTKGLQLHELPRQDRSLPPCHLGDPHSSCRAQWKCLLQGASLDASPALSAGPDPFSGSRSCLHPPS